MAGSTSGGSGATEKMMETFKGHSSCSNDEELETVADLLLLIYL